VTETPSTTPADRALAAAIAKRLDLVLPAICIPGVAANARLLEMHQRRLAEPEA